MFSCGPFCGDRTRALRSAGRAAMRPTELNQPCRQQAGHVAALTAQLRDSRDFPDRCLGQGADGKQPVGGNAYAAHHCALGAYIQSDPQWVGARNPVDYQCPAAAGRHFA